MLDSLRKAMTCRRTLKEVARLDRHLRDDIGLGHVEPVPASSRETILLMARGPFERQGH